MFHDSFPYCFIIGDFVAEITGLAPRPELLVLSGIALQPKKLQLCAKVFSLLGRQSSKELSCPIRRYAGASGCCHSIVGDSVVEVLLLESQCALPQPKKLHLRAVAFSLLILRLNSTISETKKVLAPVYHAPTFHSCVRSLVFLRLRLCLCIRLHLHPHLRLRLCLHASLHLSLRVCLRICLHLRPAFTLACAFTY